MDPFGKKAYETAENARRCKTIRNNRVTKYIFTSILIRFRVTSNPLKLLSRFFNKLSPSDYPATLKISG